MRLILIIFSIGLFISDGLSQNSGKQDYYKVKAKYVDFFHNDSVIEFTIFIEPTGNFYFKKGLIRDSDIKETKYRVEKGKTKKDSVIFDTAKNTKVISYFKDFIKDSSSIKNHYPHPYNPEPFYYEMQYSYILNNLIEPKISQDSNEQILRLVIPNETSGTERDYYSIRVDLVNGILVNKMGGFNDNLDYELYKNESASLTDKQKDKIISRLNLCDFDGTVYFTEVGLDVYPKYLIEYYNGSDYYVFEKQLLSRNRKDKEFNRLISELLMIKNKVIPKN